MPSGSNPLPNPSKFLSDLLVTLSRLPRPSSSEAGNTSDKTTSPAKPYLLTLHALFPSTLLPALDLLDRQLVTRHVLAGEVETERDVSTIHSPANIEISIEPPGEADTILSNSESQLPAARKISAPCQASTIPKQTYYVKSSQWQHSAKQRRYGGYSAGAGGTYDYDKSYEVRPWAWSCTCAAFAFAAYNHEGGEDPGDDDHGNEEVLRATSADDRSGRGGEHVEEGAGMDGEDGGFGKGWGGLMGVYRDREWRGDEPLCKHLLACLLAEWWGEARNLVEVKHVGREEVAGWAAGWGG